MLLTAALLRSLGMTASHRYDATPEYSFFVVVLLPALAILSAGVAFDITAMRREPKARTIRIRGPLALAGLVLVGATMFRIVK